MNEATATPEPPAIGRRFIKYMLAFSVSVAVGLAPFLGTLNVPLFKPLLNILPPDEGAAAIPISAALMGIIAVAVQWYASERLKRDRLSRLFVRMLLLAVLLLLLFYVVDVMVVTRIPVARDDVAVILHGFGSAICDECRGKANMECVRNISFDPSRIEACWGSPSLQVARISLTLSYLAATASFAALVSLLVIRRPRR